MERGRETSMCGCLSSAPHQRPGPHPSMCPDWESNRLPFGLQASTQSAEPYQPGQKQGVFCSLQIYQSAQSTGRLLCPCSIVTELISTVLLVWRISIELISASSPWSNTSLGSWRVAFLFSDNSEMVGLRMSNLGPWLVSSVGWSIVPIHHGCGFDPRSGHIQETSICKWNNKLISLSLPLSL